MPKERESSKKKRKAEEKRHQDEERLRKRRLASQPKAVPRTVPPENTTNPVSSVAVPPVVIPPPLMLPPPPSINPDPSPQDLPEASPEAEVDASPPRERILTAAERANRKRRKELRKILSQMHDDTTRRAVSDDLEDYHDQARLVPRAIHPFCNVHDVLMFGRTYKESDFDWSALDNKDDNEEMQSEDEDSDEDEDGEDEDDGDESGLSPSKRARRIRELTHKRELFYQYNALLDTIPDLRSDIELLTDEQVKTLANYIQYECGKARSTDTGHLVDRIIAYIPHCTTAPCEKFPTLLPKERRGWECFHMARELIPPEKLESFLDDCEKVCGDIMDPSADIYITAEDWPSAMFDLEQSLYKDDADVLDGAVRGELHKACTKSLFTGPLSVSIPGGRRDRTPGKQPIAVIYELKELTPRNIAYTAVQMRHCLTAGKWGVMDHDFNNSEFFDSIVAMYQEPLSPWAIKNLAWWNAEVFGNSARKTAKKLTAGRTTISRMLKTSLKRRNRKGKGKSRTRKQSSSSPTSSSPAPATSDDKNPEEDVLEYEENPAFKVDGVDRSSSQPGTPPRSSPSPPPQSTPPQLTPASPSQSA